uniref:Uncharacterized protein n=1 Tax=Glossina austeni TaxID=7395 RepID=A0A1A9VPM6_GLOAU
MFLFLTIGRESVFSTCWTIYCMIIIVVLDFLFLFILGIDIINGKLCNAKIRTSTGGSGGGGGCFNVKRRLMLNINQLHKAIRPMLWLSFQYTLVFDINSEKIFFNLTYPIR